MGRIMNAEEQLNLPPGFRFFPTDEELVVHYLCRKAASQPLAVPIIAEVDLYKFDPWCLPEKALFGEKEWYFFTPRDRKYPNGSRPNRAAGSGYWKATGADKPITAKNSGKRVGIKKALVFYVGKAPKGTKTNWIMHEYRLAEVNRSAKKKGSLRLDDWVLCRIYNKKSSVDKLAKEQQKEWPVNTTTVDEIDDVDTEMLHSHSGNINFEHSQDSTKCAPSPDCTTTSVQDSKVSAVTNPMNPYFQNQKLNNGYPMEHTELAPLFSSMLNSRSTYDRSDLVAPPLLMTDSSCSMHSSPDIKTEKEEVQSNLKLAELMQQQDNNNNNNNSNLSQSLFNFAFESPFPQLDQLQSQDPLQDFLASLSAPTYMQRPY